MSAGNCALYRSFCELCDLAIWPTGNQLENIQRAGGGRFVDPIMAVSSCLRFLLYHIQGGLKELIINCQNCQQRKTRCSAIAERPRCRVRYSFRQK